MTDNHITQIATLEGQLQLMRNERDIYKKYFEKTIFLMKKNGFTGEYLKALNEVEKELTGK